MPHIKDLGYVFLPQHLDCMKTPPRYQPPEWFHMLSKDMLEILEGVEDLRIVRLFMCDVAERCLYRFEDAFPYDVRPREALETARLFANNCATAEELADCHHNVDEILDYVGEEVAERARVNQNWEHYLALDRACVALFALKSATSEKTHEGIFWTCDYSVHAICDACAQDRNLEWEEDKFDPASAWMPILSREEDKEIEQRYEQEKAWQLEHLRGLVSKPEPEEEMVQKEEVALPDVLEAAFGLTFENQETLFQAIVEVKDLLERLEAKLDLGEEVKEMLFDKAKKHLAAKDEILLQTKGQKAALMLANEFKSRAVVSRLADALQEEISE